MDNHYWVRPIEASDGSGQIASYVVECAGPGAAAAPVCDSEYMVETVGDAASRNAALEAAEKRRDALNSGDA